MVILRIKDERKSILKVFIGASHVQGRVVVACASSSSAGVCGRQPTLVALCGVTCRQETSPLPLLPFAQAGQRLIPCDMRGASCSWYVVAGAWVS